MKLECELDVVNLMTTIVMMVTDIVDDNDIAGTKDS